MIVPQENLWFIYKTADGTAAVSAQAQHDATSTCHTKDRGEQP